ncbi:DNA-binding response regulator [Nocardioides sp. dk4132]|uniref:response regulator transcription factor n=1 Tax=unclassified Nocardioides TaxID=2615069 RepID=UPI0012980B7D|nr:MULTISPECIES: response regulator transcription factor [unclassified Nocardioides]MQW74895.1 DNA-binding response regulator [Nocardioides sp. dk4132]QGA07914.1 DNA-binding response regulator [Nocardioides sp. dk884]
MKPVKVVLSNDYELVLRGLAAMLAPHADLIEVIEASTGTDFEPEADVILFDTFGRLPGKDEKLRTVVTANPKAKIVVYSWDTYPPEVAHEHGAVGWIGKGVSGQELAERLVEVHQAEGGGGFTVNADTEGKGEESTMADWPGRAHGLSPREGEILGMICRGLTNEEIAARSFLSINTIKTYIRTAYRKIGATSRPQAILWGIDHGLRGEGSIEP